MNTQHERRRDWLRYEILRDCACGPEEFFVLISSIDTAAAVEVTQFVSTLSTLVDEGLLAAMLNSRPITGVTVRQLEDYVRARRRAGEELDQPTDSVPEYSFTTTDIGIALLKEEDRPD